MWGTFQLHQHLPGGWFPFQPSPVTLRRTWLAKLHYTKHRKLSSKRRAHIQAVHSLQVVSVVLLWQVGLLTVPSDVKGIFGGVACQCNKPQKGPTRTLTPRHQLHPKQLVMPHHLLLLVLHMSASWIGQSAHSAKRVLWNLPGGVGGSSGCFFKIYFLRCSAAAVWTQRIWTVIRKAVTRPAAHVSTRPEWHSSVAPPTGNKPGYLSEGGAGGCHKPLPPLLSDSLLGTYDHLGSVSGLVEQDVSWLRVLGNVRGQTVELLDRLRVNFLREKTTTEVRTRIRIQ